MILIAWFLGAVAQGTKGAEGSGFEFGVMSIAASAPLRFIFSNCQKLGQKQAE
jgi:hypothetical protein